MIIKEIKESILNILLPKKCVNCGKEGQYICNDCELFLSETENFLLKEKIVSVWDYEGVIEKAILKIKYNGIYHAINELTEKAVKIIINDMVNFQDFLEFFLNPDTYITYVPMFKEKERERGFNQAELIAQNLYSILNQTKDKQLESRIIPLLMKIKNNQSQVGLSPRERFENVKNAFVLNQVKHQIKKVVLIDDVYTTGATVNECLKVLKQGEIKDVYVFTLCRKLNT